MQNNETKEPGPQFAFMHAGVTPRGLIFWHAWAGTSCIRTATCSLEASPSSQGWEDHKQPPSSCLSPLCRGTWSSSGEASEPRRPPSTSLWASGVMQSREADGHCCITEISWNSPSWSCIVSYACWKVRKKSVCYGRVCWKIPFCSVQVM